MKEKNTFNLLLIFLGGVVLLFIFAPLANLYLDTSKTELFESARDSEVIDSIFLTLKISFFTTLLFALFAIPLSYLLARKKFTGKSIVQGIIDLPIVIPHSAAGIAVLGFVSRDTFLGKFAGELGINFVGHPIGIGFAMAFVSLPFLINSARDGFIAVPEQLEKTAYSLGASYVRTFFTISLPLAHKSIITGLILMFARGMSEFGAVIILAYHPMVTPILIYERFTSYGLENAKTISVIFISVSMVFFIILRIISSKNEKK